MTERHAERRKYPRFDTDLTVYFRVKYDIKTRIEFQVVGNHRKEGVAPKYSGTGRNVNVEGMCFVSKKKLEKGDLLELEVYEPGLKKPVMAEARVKWSKKLPRKAEEEDAYYTGVQLLKVNDRNVSDSVYFDQKYHVAWSAVLEALFGSFARLHEKR